MERTPITKIINAKAAVLTLIHGNEPEIHRELVPKLQADPIENVDLIVVNTKAAARNLRYAGKVEQAMNRHPNAKGDDDERAVFRTVRRVKAKNYRDEYDIHTNKLPGVNYVAVGPKTTKGAIARGAELGFTRCLVEDQVIYQYLPNLTSVEISIADTPPQV